MTTENQETTDQRRDSSVESTDLFSVDTVRDAIDAEAELPGDMPDHIWDAIRNDRDVACECMRIAVRETKRGILERLKIEPKNSENVERSREG
jgi:hypothetical protein